MITMRTIRYKNHVAYSVENAERTIWGRTVQFGHDVAHRAGGVAFQAAACEQERQARLAAGPDERVEEVLEEKSV